MCSGRVTSKLKRIEEYVDRSLMLVTALSPVIGYDNASKIAHYAMDNDLTLKAAALKLGFVTEDEFGRIVDPAKWSNRTSQPSNNSSSKFFTSRA